MSLRYINLLIRFIDIQNLGDIKFLDGCVRYLQYLFWFNVYVVFVGIVCE